jgi:hypothetical protein
MSSTNLTDHILSQINKTEELITHLKPIDIPALTIAHDLEIQNERIQKLLQETFEHERNQIAEEQRKKEVIFHPAQLIYKQLSKYIRDFERELDEEHEIGARLVSFGSTITFHIENVRYYDPYIITFYGINDNGEKVQLIQHTSQLNVLLVAMKKLQEKPNRVGFLMESN